LRSRSARGEIEMPIRLVLADDHPLILDGLENLFRTEEDFQVLARCVNGVETLQAVRDYRPDILVLDIRMQGKDGLEVAREMHKDNLPTRVVLLTAALDEEELLEAMRLGVQGVVLKEMAPQTLLACIRKVHAGEEWFDSRSAKHAIDKLLRREAGAREVAAILTPQEMTIVRMLAEGLRNKEIGDKLHISEGTVKVHLHNIFAKLGVDSRLALLRYAQEKGLV
jgi:DNA-binding NarL/FixJ family response regulator